MHRSVFILTILILTLAACDKPVTEDDKSGAENTAPVSEHTVSDSGTEPATVDHTDCWRMQDGGPQHHRRAAAIGPDGAEIRWLLDIEDCRFDTRINNTYGHAYGSCVHDGRGTTYLCGNLSGAARAGTDGSGVLYAVTSDGVIAWSRSFHGAPICSPVVLDSGEIVVAAVESLTEDGPDGEAIDNGDPGSEYRSSLLVLDARGEIADSINTAGLLTFEPVEMSGGLFLVSLAEFFDDDGDGIFLDIRHYLAAIDRAGHEHWRREIDDPPVPPAVSIQGVIYAAAYLTREISAINSAGEELWTRTLQGFPRGRIAVGDDGGLYIHVHDDGEARLRNGLEAVRPDGSIRWFIDAQIDDTGIALGPDGTVLFVEELPDQQSTAGTETALYRPLSCYDSAGTLQWRYFNPDFPVINEFVLDSTGNVFLTTTYFRNSVMSVGPTGKERWQVPVEGRYLWDWKPSIGPDGSIHVLVRIEGTHQRLYCFGPGTPVQAPEPESDVVMTEEPAGEASDE